MRCVTVPPPASSVRRALALSVFRAQAGRFFSSSSGDGNGGVANPITSSVGAYDTGGVEGRLRRKRGPPPLSAAGEPLRRVGYALTAPTDEELYLQAGVPGYGESSVPRRPTWGAALAPEPAPAAPAPAAPAPAPAAPAAAAIAAQVRIATGLVPVGSLPSFLSAWRLLALPAYRGIDGCLGARLLLGAQRAEDAAAGAAERGRVRGGALQVVVALTEWRDARALDAVQDSADYARAMGALAAYFKGAPEVVTYACERADVLA